MLSTILLLICPFDFLSKLSNSVRSWVSLFRIAWPIGPSTHSLPNPMKTRLLPIWVILITTVFVAGSWGARWKKSKKLAEKTSARRRLSSWQESKKQRGKEVSRDRNRILWESDCGRNGEFWAWGDYVDRDWWGCQLSRTWMAASRRFGCGFEWGREPTEAGEDPLSESKYRWGTGLDTNQWFRLLRKWWR